MVWNGKKTGWNGKKRDEMVNVNKFGSGGSKSLKMVKMSTR